jgi:hypothetical protein
MNKKYFIRIMVEQKPNYLIMIFKAVEEADGHGLN